MNARADEWDDDVLEAVAARVGEFFSIVNLMTDQGSIRRFSADSRCSEIATYLTAQSFDLAVVVGRTGEPCYASVEELRASGAGRAEDVAHSIDAAMRIRADARIVDVIRAFRELCHLFVFDANGELRGLVTYADLNKPPIHVLCFIAFTEFESLLRRVVAEVFDGDSWLRSLPEKGRADVGAVYVSDKAQGVETSLLECTTLTHLKEILQPQTDWQRTAGYESRDQFKQRMDTAIRWRNSIMHNRTIVRDRHGGRALYEIIQEIGAQARSIGRWLDGRRRTDGRTQLR